VEGCGWTSAPGRLRRRFENREAVARFRGSVKMCLEAGWVLTWAILVTPMPLGVPVSIYDMLQDWEPVGARSPSGCGSMESCLSCKIHQNTHHLGTSSSGMPWRLPGEGQPRGEWGWTGPGLAPGVRPLWDSPPDLLPEQPQCWRSWLVAVWFPCAAGGPGGFNHAGLCCEGDRASRDSS